VEALGHVTYAEAARLSLDPARAKEELGWIPVWDFEKTVAETARWYQARHANAADAASMLELTCRQISDYTNDAALAGVTWAK
jgi:dTDP-D-glucose 4,6-dehydratase